MAELEETLKSASWELTLDTMTSQLMGISFNDPFGLNDNGFGGMRNPVSLDFVDQVIHRHHSI